MKWSRKTIERIEQALIERGMWPDHISIVCSSFSNGWLTVETRLSFGAGREWHVTSCFSYDYMDLAKFDVEEAVASKIVAQVSSIKVDRAGAPIDDY